MNYTKLGDTLAEVEQGGFFTRNWARLSLWAVYGSILNAENVYTVWLNQNKVIKKTGFVQHGAMTGRYSPAPVIEEETHSADYGLIEAAVVGAALSENICNDDSPSSDSFNVGEDCN